MRQRSYRLSTRLPVVTLAIAFAALSPNAVAGKEASLLGVGSSGYATRIPDRAWIRFSVSIEAKTPAEAVDGNAAGIKGLLDQLRARGLTSKDLQSAALSLQPKFEVKRDGMREVRGELIGYVASKSVVATFEDVAVVPAYIREFPLAGTLRIADIGFFSTQVEAAQSEALVDAIQRAQKAAQTAVAAAGRQLGTVSSMEVSISTDRNGPPQVNEPIYTYPQQSEGALGARLIVEPGEQQFNQTVNLQWQLR